MVQNETCTRNSPILIKINLNNKGLKGLALDPSRTHHLSSFREKYATKMNEIRFELKWGDP